MKIAVFFDDRENVSNQSSRATVARKAQTLLETILEIIFVIIPTKKLVFFLSEFDCDINSRRAGKAFFSY